MSAAGNRDWAQLPPELLGSIAERLMAEDYIRFGAACTAWASAASTRDGRYLPLAPQMPWLLLIGDEGQRGESCTLVSLPDRRRRLIGPLPEMRGKSCIGSQDGWLALLDECSEVSFLNVLTGSRIHLPSVTTIPDVNPVYNSDGSLSEYLYTIRVIDRNCEIPHEGSFCDLMWSDPEEIETWAVSPRGAGWLFGSSVTSEFNHINNLDLVCRAHQLVQEGLKYMFEDKGLVTV